MSPEMGCIIVENTDIKMCPSYVSNNYSCDIVLLIQKKISLSTCEINM